MSVIKETTVMCDYCGNWIRGEMSSESDIRHYLKKLGWTRAKANQVRVSRDFCPECSKIRKEKSNGMES